MIREPEIRLIDHEGEHIGLIKTAEALEKAEDLGLDLVEVASNSKPPVCRIMDHGQYKYEQSKRQKEARKRQKIIVVKEIKMRPTISKHDYDFKIRHARAFLDHGEKVRFIITFYGRLMARTELGRVLLEKVIKELEEVTVVEMPPRREGRIMSMVLVAKPEKDREDKTEPKNDSGS